jgi:magnesium transporter
MEEAREKIELFRNYYFVCFRSFDQDPYSPTHLDPINMYVVVFREGTLSVGFTPKAQNYSHVRCSSSTSAQPPIRRM